MAPRVAIHAAMRFAKDAAKREEDIVEARA
jgi:hypothetical protein